MLEMNGQRGLGLLIFLIDFTSKFSLYSLLNCLKSLFLRLLFSSLGHWVVCSLCFHGVISLFAFISVHVQHA